MKTIQMTVIGLAVAAALAAQEPADVFFTAPLQVRTSATPTFEFIAGGMLGGSAVKGAPYTAQAVTESTQTLADGNRIVNRSTSSIARDSEGRERREQSLSNLGPFAAQGDPVQMIFISDSVAGVNYSLDSKDKVAIKLPIPDLSADLANLPKPPAGANVMIHRVGATGIATGAPGLPAGAVGPDGPRVMFFHRELKTEEAGTQLAAPAGVASGSMVAATAIGAVGAPGVAGAPDVEQLGSKTIEGVQATGTRTTFRIPAGQIGNDKPIDIVDERWYSSELQITVVSEHRDPRMGTTSYSLKSVSRGEPSPTLFQVPADYTVNAPEPFTQKLP